jgi:Zn-dependent peptidase ImmA (M78 family)
MKRPSRVRVGGHEFTIRYRKFADKEKALGLCIYKDARVEIATGQTPFDTRDTVLHEIMHALLAKQGHVGSCFKNETEERYVNALASGVVGVLQDNPELAKWLIEPLTKEKP